LAFCFFFAPLGSPHPQLTLFFLATAQNGILKGKFKNACQHSKKQNAASYYARRLARRAGARSNN